MFEPKQNVIDSTVLIPNLLNYIVANQTDAFKKVNGGQPLKSFAAVYNSSEGRVIETFPSFCLVTDQIESRYSGDLIDADWRLLVEIALEGGDASKLTLESKKYFDAVQLLFLNIGNELVAGSRTETIAKLSEKGVVATFDEVGKGIKSPYAQVLSIAGEFRIRTEGFKE